MTICMHTPIERQRHVPCALCQVEEFQHEVRRLQQLIRVADDVCNKAATEIEQLRGRLTLAEEGLANYALEVERLNNKCSMLAMLHYGSPGAMPDDPLPKEILRMRGWLDYLQQRKPHNPDLWLLMHDALKGVWAPKPIEPVPQPGDHT